MERMPASLVNSLASQIISEMYSWDQTRYGGTIPSTPTCTATNVCNCNDNGCDACSPTCCYDGTCPWETRAPPTTTTTTTRTTPTCTATNICNCGEIGCDSCSPACCHGGNCPWQTSRLPTTTVKDRCDGFNCQACGSPFDSSCCWSSYCGAGRLLVVDGAVVATIYGTAPTVVTITATASGSALAVTTTVVPADLPSAVQVVTGGVADMGYSYSGVTMAVPTIVTITAALASVGSP